MQPRIEKLHEKKLVGQRMIMSFTNNKTGLLWQRFMPLRKEITNSLNNYLYSIEIYPLLYFDKFDPSKEFEKWAAIEVASFEFVHSGMEALTIQEGLYAVFVHRGPASEGPKTYHYIFETWVPNSEYKLDNRPHFALMGEKYKNEDPDSEEEIWIPVKLKE